MKSCLTQTNGTTLTEASISLEAYSLKIKGCTAFHVLPLKYLCTRYITHSKPPPFQLLKSGESFCRSEEQAVQATILIFLFKIPSKASTPKAQQKPWNSEITAAIPHKFCLFFYIPSWVQKSCSPAKHLNMSLNLCCPEQMLLPELNYSRFCSITQIQISFWSSPECSVCATFLSHTHSSC